MLIFVYLNILKSNLYYYYNCSVVNVVFEVANSKIRIRDIGLGSEFAVAMHKKLRKKLGLRRVRKSILPICNRTLREI